MTCNRVCLAVLLAVGMMPLVVGCGGDGRVSVSGTVVFHGKAVPNLFVKFQPEGSGDPAWGYTDAQGKFALVGADNAIGVKPGTYRVWVDYRTPDPDPNKPPPAEGFGPPRELQPVLPKYGMDSSQLSMKIDGPRNDLTITLE